MSFLYVVILFHILFNLLSLHVILGMTTLTWNSMNIDAYKHNVTVGLQKVEELIIAINDIIDNIIEKNLKIVGKVS